MHRPPLDHVVCLVGLDRLPGHGPPPNVVEAGTQRLDIQPEHGKLRNPVTVPQPDRVCPARTVLVLGDHEHAPAVLLHVVDGAGLSRVALVPVAIVLAHDAATS
ncbi:hypothetical protein GCM10027610_022910 [Dactylosporangium cerinum]